MRPLGSVPMPPVALIATLRSLNGKPNDPGAPPLADISLRCEATPELLNLFSGIGQEFDVVFTRRGGEQMEMFNGNSEVFDFATADDDDTDTSEALDDEDQLVIETNGTVAEPEPAVTRGRRR